MDEETDGAFEESDNRVNASATYRELFRIIRTCLVQPSCHWMVRKMEQETVKLLRADQVHLYLIKKDGYRREGKSYPLGEGLTGHVHRTKELLNIQQPLTDPRFKDPIDAPHDGLQPTALLCVPVEADHRSDCAGPKDVVAIFQAFRTEPHARFTNRDCRVLARLGEFAGNMLRNSSKLDQAQAMYNATLTTHQRSAALLEVAKALASETSLNSLVSIIVRQVPELIDCDRCTLFFVEPNRQFLTVNKHSSHGRRKTLVSWIFGQSNAPELPFQEGKDLLYFPIDRGMSGHVALTGEVINIQDAHVDKRFNSSVDAQTGYRTRSMLCVPMVDDKNTIIGVVQAINKNPMFPRFDKDDEVLLKTFSAQAALAVRNCQLFERTQTALRQSNAVLEVTNALSRELRLGSLIRLIAMKVQELLDAERCTVFIVDREKKEIYTSEHMSWGVGPALPIDTRKEKMIYFQWDRGIVGSVATTGKPINIGDAYTDERFNKAMDLKTGYRTKSILCMAVKNHRDDIVGVLQCMNKRSGARVFTDDDQNLLQAFCAQAAVAIENSRLFHQTEKALNHALADQRNVKFMLSVTKNLFSDMHLTSMIDQLTMQVHHLLKADDCALYLVDEAKKEFWLAKDESTPNTKRWPLGTGIAGIIAATGTTIRISSSAHKDPRFVAEVDQRKDKTTHSILCCPIKAESEEKTSIIGVISVRDEKDRGGFEQEEEKLLKVFCAQAAVAIMNARKFSNIMEQGESKDGPSSSDYLKELEVRGMKLASDTIEPFQYKMEDIQLKGCIGTGSYGEVYRAVVKGQVVAVKKLHVRNLKAEQVDAFCKEASLMCQLVHPNIVGFIGAITEPSNLCIITQYCARGSLADLLLEESIPMDFALKLKFCRDAARGMLYLHNSNPIILHRDLKSDNLLVAHDWTIKVADFGLTRFLSEKRAMTQVGTPMWMAPEIIMGRKYTEKADVYAFGIILWEILTRLEPYEDKEPMQIVVEVVNDDLRPDIPPEYKDNPLVPLMKDCWHTDPGQRPTFRVVLERIEAIPGCQVDPKKPEEDSAENDRNVYFT